MTDLYGIPLEDLTANLRHRHHFVLSYLDQWGVRWYENREDFIKFWDHFGGQVIEEPDGRIGELVKS